MLAAKSGTDIVCAYESYFHDGCDHAAEHLSVRVADEVNECATLEIFDEIGAFDWYCRRDGGDLVFETMGLNASAGLATLVDADGWKLNRFVARAGTVERFASEPAVWWDNPVVPLPDNSSSGQVMTLADSRTIYTLAASRGTAGYVIAADHIGIVILDTAVLGPAPGPLNCGRSQNVDEHCLVTTRDELTGLWIEGDFDGRGAATSNYGLLLYAPQWSTLRHVRAHHHMGPGVFVEYADAMMAFDYIATHNLGAGFEDFSSNVTARHVVTANNAGAGFSARSYGLHSLADVRSYNNGDGIRFFGDAVGMFADVLVANNEGAGLFWTAAYQGGSVHALTAISNASVGVDVENLFQGSMNRVVSVDNGGNGLRLVTDSSSELAEIVAAHNTGYGVEMTNNDDMLFVGNLMLGNNGLGQCLVTGGTNPGLDNACARTPLVGDTTLGIDLTSSFVGGASTASEPAIVDWTLPLPEQAWGRDDATLTAGRGRCQPGTTCRVWDFALRATDTVLRNAVNATPQPFVAGAICPAGAHGDVELSLPTEQCLPTYNAPCPRSYHRNALEILDDHVGNEDGYCESAERCIYLPHMSAYAGRGELIGPCVFEDGTDAGSVTGVTMYGYAD